MNFTIEATFEEYRERRKKTIKDFDEETEKDFYNEMFKCLEEYNRIKKEREERGRAYFEERTRQHKLKFSATKSLLINTLNFSN
jgi:CRISPR/Cas system CMR subunit Cmr6 (Cas7 group RAMP superfamily)